MPVIKALADEVVALFKDLFNGAAKFNRSWNTLSDKRSFYRS